MGFWKKDTEKKDKFGQYFTPAKIINRMGQELMALNPTGLILDPCAGTGQFFDLLKYDKTLEIEIQPDDFNLIQRPNKLNVDYLTTPMANIGAIIMNPPYNRSVKFNKADFPTGIRNFPYAAFIYKALQETDKIVAVIPSGFMTDGKEQLRNLLIKNGLKKIIINPETQFEEIKYTTCIIVVDKNYQDDIILEHNDLTFKIPRIERIIPLYYCHEKRKIFDRIAFSNDIEKIKLMRNK
jgi:type I restriction-modification system DNA methylase subunit